MIDFHTHILPGIDDGSQSIRESLAMMEMESRQGVGTVLATPHFYAHNDTVSRFLSRRQEAYHNLAGQLKGKEAEIPIYAGAEVYYFPGIGNADQLSELCAEGTSLLLLELPFTQWTEKIYSDIKKMIEKQKLTVLLAHVERYYKFQKDRKIWDIVFELPLFAQINAGNMDHRKKRHFIEKFMKKNVPFVLGSDCHNTDVRIPNVESGRNALEKQFGSQIIVQIEKTEERLLGQDE